VARLPADPIGFSCGVRLGLNFDKVERFSKFSPTSRGLSMCDVTKAMAFNHGPRILLGCLNTKEFRRRKLRLFRLQLLVTVTVTLFWSGQHSLGVEHDWYECPVGQTKHVDLNKISLIKDSVIRPNQHTLRFYSFSSHFLLGVSAAGFSDQMLEQLESILITKSNWVQIHGTNISIFVNLDYVVGCSSGPGGGYILVLTTGEDVVVTAEDNQASSKIKEFGFP
jgi:hypothetical protein